ncbi:MAG: hypothetical protein IJD43_11405 [Thermoguttaceae bacterium]|nr:hypothetical protein [Thermoguttaceae bacterium]
MQVRIARTVEIDPDITCRGTVKAESHPIVFCRIQVEICGTVDVEVVLDAAFCSLWSYVHF